MSFIGLGSVSEHCSHHMPCPTLVVRGDDAVLNRGLMQVRVCLLRVREGRWRKHHKLYGQPRTRVWCGRGCEEAQRVLCG